MTKIVMSSLSASNDWPMVGVALRRNQFHNFQILDFSNNRMDYEALASLGRGIQAFTHGLRLFFCLFFLTFPFSLLSFTYSFLFRELNLSNCSIPSKGIAALFKSFCCNLGVSLSIQFLDISFNQMDEVPLFLSLSLSPPPFPLSPLPSYLPLLPLPPPFPPFSLLPKLWLSG